MRTGLRQRFGRVVNPVTDMPAIKPYRQESLPPWIKEVASFKVRVDPDKKRFKRGMPSVYRALSESSHLELEDVDAEHGTLWLVGICPACGHEMDKVIRHQRRPEDDPEPDDDPEEERREVVVYCNCATTHPNQPADRTGCGSYGVLSVSTAPGSEGSVIEGKTAIPDQLRWELRAEELYASRLDDIRATAVKWTAGVTSITGVFGIVALVKGPETIGELDEPWRQIVYGLVIAAVLLALIAIGVAAAAAGGTPRAARLSGRDARRWNGWQAAAAKTELLYSRRAAYVAVLTMLTAIGLTWFGAKSS